MYIEASSPRSKGDNAKLLLSVSGSKAPACLEFYYHMYGDNMGALTVFSGNAVVLNVSGNQGYTWKKASRTIYLSYTVSFFYILITLAHIVNNPGTYPCLRVFFRFF